MMIRLEHDNGKFIAEIQLPKHQQRKIKTFLINEHERWYGKPKTNVLLFSGGEWYVPEQISNKMYKAIVLAYSQLIHDYEKEQEILSQLVVTKSEANKIRASRNKSIQGVNHS